MKLWLLRHAPVLLPPGLCYGASDVPADEALTRQAAQAATARLPADLPVWVSGLRRAQQLAHALQAQRPDLAPLRIDSRLNEMDFGCWELQAWDAIPHAAVEEWVKAFTHHRFGGVESTQCVIDRVGQAIADLRAALGADGQAVWITHAGVIRAINYIAAHGSQRPVDLDLWPTDAIAPGASQEIIIKFESN
ncbi:MAG TPA: phosphoglycerate kinase [Oxalobacteraceae bacterium]|nr:phosphoglycerate kinase [Oxalobacteraceae bacterium]